MYGSVGLSSLRGVASASISMYEAGIEDGVALDEQDESRLMSRWAGVRVKEKEVRARRTCP